MDEVEFGRYRLLSLLGEGGMGEVWRAHDTVTNRVVAIKVLSAKLSKDEEFQRRFRREAEAAARLETPHVVPIHDYGEIDGRLFVCMRLIKGRDLAAVLVDGQLEPARAARIIGQVAEALHAAHEIGLIHRDIKPSNILLDDRDFAYLIDFGIARIADDTRMTKTGNTIGTFAYIAPERLDRQGTEDARVDIYSLACVLYECLTGEPPFTDDTMPRLIVAHLSEPPPRPSIARPELPAQVDEVIATGMAKDPNQRYATTVELADAARDAITVPIQRTTASPAPKPSPTEPATSPANASRIGHEMPPQPPPTAFASAATQQRLEKLPIYAGQSQPEAETARLPEKSPSPSERFSTPILVGMAVTAVILSGVGILLILERRPAERGEAAALPWFYGGIASFCIAGLIIAVSVVVLIMKWTSEPTQTAGVGKPRLAKRRIRWAIASLAASLIGVMGLVGVLGLHTMNLTWQLVSLPTYLGSVVGIVLGGIALRPINPDRQQDRKLAFAGIAVGAAVLIMYFIEYMRV